MSTRLSSLMLMIMMIDALFITAGLYLLGGQNAVYGLPIFMSLVAMAAVVHSGRGSQLIALLATASYGSMILATQAGWLAERRGPFPFTFAEAWPWATVLVMGVAMTTLAFVASSLSGATRRALDRSRRFERELRELNEELESRVEEAVRALRDANASLAEKNAQLERMMEQVELFAKAVSHDLRNPVCAAGEALRLASEASHRSQAQLIRLSRENLERADNMLMGLRDLMRTVGSRASPRLEPLECVIGDVIEEVQLATRRQLPRIRSVGGLGDVEVTRDQLTYVLRNLIGNALEHNAGDEDLRVEVGVEEHGGSWRFFVRDSGKGMPPEVQARAFEPFHRGNAASGGLGLGLALVHAIVTRSGGEIWIESAPGEGATFWFTLPELIRRRERDRAGTTAAV